VVTTMTLKIDVEKVEADFALEEFMLAWAA
jgi:hypothetical protein